MFLETPVRRRSTSLADELYRITERVTAFALARPDVAFKLWDTSRGQALLDAKVQ